MDVQTYIDKSEETYKWALGWLENYRAISMFNRNMAEVCLMAMHPFFWQVYVILMGYCKENNVLDPNKVLLEVPFEQVFRGEVEYPWTNVPYLSYATRFKTVSPNIFLGTAYVLRLTLAESSLKNDPITYECIMGCINKHDENWDAMTKCVEEERC